MTRPHTRELGRSGPDRLVTYPLPMSLCALIGPSAEIRVKSGTLIHKLTKMHSKRSSALQIAHEQLLSTNNALRESFFQVLCVYLRRLSFYRLQNLFSDGLGAIDRRRTSRRGLVAFCEGVEEVGRSHSRIDQPKGNVVGSQLLAADERNGVECGLCGGVGSDGIRPVSLRWDLRSTGADIDNHAPALGSHNWNDLLHRRDDADDVDFEDGAIRLEIHLLDRDNLPLRGIIDQHVDALTILLRLGHHMPYRSLIAQISWHCNSLREF